ncbi:hypothetical protein M440DRAFT_337851 [Trichoderma longibrachiatum ATCC 18648]|uniref:Zn(2)-C6 fungal-type domain-containing protein n=1 Tax=Trichoderma longibrachiatum ATCC 18648 TaxID=983965 RepID=A0A2T4C0Q6_TRILO|nr:hypothetical protein M440DRAFT_337851 [Trichoderma longibrachiatum ATCC 18648]
MSQNTPSSQRASLARFARAHCRQKKIKCSRELPKCAACRPWPGDCVYHRLSPTSQPAQTTPVQVSTKAPINLAQEHQQRRSTPLPRRESLGHPLRRNQCLPQHFCRKSRSLRSVLHLSRVRSQGADIFITRRRGCA